MAKGSSNPRYGRQYSKRDKLRRRIAMEGRPCAICGKPIDYTLTWWVDPVDGKRKRHPMSYELDEKIPVSKYWLGGYATPTQAATDYDNVQPAHRRCNQSKSNKVQAVRIESDEGAAVEPTNPTSRAW